MYSLKNFKHLPRLSEETNAFTATLYKNNKKIANCENTGKGEPTRIHWLDKYERNSFNDFIKNHSPYESNGFTLTMTDDLFVDSLVFDEISKKEDEKQIKKLIKKGYTFVLKKESYGRCQYAATTQESDVSNLKKDGYSTIYSS